MTGEWLPRTCNFYHIKSFLFISSFLTKNWTIPALNVTDVAPVCLLFLHTIALLTLTLTNPNLSPDGDLDRNPILDPVFNVYPDLNCTRRNRHILPMHPCKPTVV